MHLDGAAGVRVRSKPAPAGRTEALTRLWQPTRRFVAAQPLTTTCCLTDIAQQPLLGGCPPIAAADDCVDTLDFCAYIPWLDHSTGADHRSRAFQITPSVALSLSLSLCTLYTTCTADALAHLLLGGAEERGQRMHNCSVDTAASVADQSVPVVAEVSPLEMPAETATRHHAS